MDIKLIAIDLDGTLLDSDHNISAENLLAIKEAKEAGIKVVLCTGRPLRSMLHFLELADLRDDEDYAITYNGGLIQKTKTGEIVNEITFDRNESFEIYELAKSLNMPVNFIDLDYIYEPDYPIGAESTYHQTIGAVPPEHALKFAPVDVNTLPDPFTINKIVISRTAEEVDSIIPQIPAEYHSKYNIYKSQEFLLEILPQHVDKGYSMRIIGDMLGLKKEQIMGIGDQENDLSLVENSGFGVAMENAIDRVKEAADYVTKSNNENGVAHVINKFVLNKK